MPNRWSSFVGSLTRTRPEAPKGQDDYGYGAMFGGGSASTIPTPGYIGASNAMKSLITDGPAKPNPVIKGPKHAAVVMNNIRTDSKRRAAAAQPKAGPATSVTASNGTSASYYTQATPTAKKRRPEVKKWD